jgi:uncharacterized membrane protein
MSAAKGEPDFELSTHRVEALGDGVFAIAMTLLILEIRLPNLHEPTPGELARSLLALWPKFLCYAISFITLGVYWVAHHLHFVTIRRADRTLLWINILFFLTIGLVPFSTALIGEYLNQQIPVILYGVNMIVIGLVLYLHWIYATKEHRLVSPDVSPQLVSTVKHVILMGPLVYVIAIGLSFCSTMTSLVLYLLVNLLYIIPGGIHLHLRHEPKSIE